MDSNCSVALEGKVKLGYPMSEVKKLVDGDPSLKAWKSKISMIIAWLVNSMEPTLDKPFMFLPTAKDVWKAVKDTYFDLENFLQMFGLSNFGNQI